MSSLRQGLQLTACENGKHDGSAGITCLIRVGPANLTSSTHSAIYQHSALHALHTFYYSWCLLCATRAMAQGATIAMTVQHSLELALIDPLPLSLGSFRYWSTPQSRCNQTLVIAVNAAVIPETDESPHQASDTHQRQYSNQKGAFTVIATRRLRNAPTLSRKDRKPLI